MTFDEYINRYSLIRYMLERDSRNLRILEGRVPGAFAEAFSTAGSPILQGLTRENEKLKASIERKKRLCRRYALRLSKAVAQISDLDLQWYARYRYVFGLTREELAEASFYSLRSSYRVGVAAKKEMIRAMRAVSPRPRRIPSARFSVKGTLRIKDYSVAARSSRIAAVFARHRKAGEPLHPWRNPVC
ncbi:MAG: hypothetical protein IKJ74_03210 [Clostridia bacterium]|nr:hypothetical protein [Clostridia bacterium]